MDFPCKIYSNSTLSHHLHFDHPSRAILPWVGKDSCIAEIATELGLMFPRLLPFAKSVFIRQPEWSFQNSESNHVTFQGLPVSLRRKAQVLTMTTYPTRSALLLPLSPPYPEAPTLPDYFHSSTLAGCSSWNLPETCHLRLCSSCSLCVQDSSLRWSAELTPLPSSLCSKPSFLVRITLTPSWLLQLAPFPSLQHWHTNDPFSEISPLLNHLESYYPHSGTRPRKCSLKHTTYTSQTSHLASASLHVKIMHCYRIGTKTCFPACMEERKKKTVWRCRIGRRMRKECHFSELNTEKLQTTNICNFNHILRDQKTSKLQHPQNLQNATGARNGRKKNPPQKAQTQKQKT